jgi:CPA1 family monovalent cation:H+ antiporter
VVGHVAFGLALVAVVLVAELLADRARLPASALLTVLGLVYALLPGPNLRLDPDLVMVVLIPPLLYSTAVNASLLAIRRNLRPVVSLSVVLVLVTTFAVGLSLHAVVPVIPIAVAIALGAAVAPPDPVAALSVGRRVGLPARLLTLIEGEGLLNDATAVTTYQIAVASAVAGVGLSWSDALGRFVLAGAGGVAVGAALAGAIRLLRPLLRDPLVANGLSLATPFAAYLAGEELHVSGVLAVVVTGLIVGHERPSTESGAGRLQTAAVWRLVDFLLEGFVFVLIGQQLPAVVAGLDAYSTGTIVAAAATAVGVALAVRPAFLALTNLTPRMLHARLGTGAEAPERHRQRLSGREIAALSWAGSRGVITLAVVFALPLVRAGGAPLAGRDLALFCAYLVVLVTLVGQGVTFAPLLRRLGVRANPVDAVRVQNRARLAAVESALRTLPDIAGDEDVPPGVVEDLRRQLHAQQRRYQARIDAVNAIELPPSGDLEMPPAYEAALRARRAVIDAQRAELVRWRDSGRLGDRALRQLETELDLQERILPERG